MSISRDNHLSPAERCFKCGSIPLALFWPMLFSVLFGGLHIEVKEILHCCVFGPVVKQMCLK